MENYIVINGKKAELTKEQLVALGIEVEKEDVFKPKENVSNFFINSAGEVLESFYNKESTIVKDRYAVANYCTNEHLMKQRALHETLNRLLWRYSMRHEGDKINWNDRTQHKYTINFDTSMETFCINYHQYHKSEGTVYFISRDVAEDALKEIIEPFIRQHPEFKW